MDESVKQVIRITVGTSPKAKAAAWAAAVVGYFAPLIVGFAATKLGVELEVGTTSAFLMPVVSAAFGAGLTFIAAWAAKPGTTMPQAVYLDDDLGRPRLGLPERSAVVDEDVSVDEAFADEPDVLAEIKGTAPPGAPPQDPTAPQA